MAVLIHTVERDFLFRTAIEERVPVACEIGGGKWYIRILRADENRMTFLHSIPARLLKVGTEHDFRFVVLSQTVAFRAMIIEAKDSTLVAEVREDVIKNLSRKFVRRAPPVDLAVSFSFKGERYALDFPVADSYESIEDPGESSDFDPSDVRALVQEFDARASPICSDRRITLFKDRKPSGLDELLVAETGRAYYNPTVLTGLPSTDPYPERRILVHSDFVEHGMSHGLELAFAEEEVVRFERSKRSEGILSELMAPIRFHEYVIGIVHIANSKSGLPPFDLGVLGTFTEFARVFAWSLKINGYFRNAPKRTDDYVAEIIDVSAGGLMFTLLDPELSKALNEGSEISVALSTPRRTVNAIASIRRRYRDGRVTYFAAGFLGMAPEDFRFLFEYLYGRGFTDADVMSVEGLKA
ncbi:MAG: PilZ domain-containing protein [Spirochaetes bacterium]|nr:PilZ domain-containing protein [Spirochaetota bacterium]